jgi:hypothetical protein
MSTATPNVAASVRARLLNVAKAQGVDFNQVLVRFALERILYRLTSPRTRIGFCSKARCCSHYGTTCHTGLRAMRTC